MAPRLGAFTLGVTTAMLIALGAPGAVGADGPDAETGNQPTAYLDGRAIPLSEVSRYFCDDFSYPVIHCSSSHLLMDVRASLVSILSSVDYVTIFQNAAYQGAAMNVSQDYPILALIGWNDNISSFKGRNGETGEFNTDWFGGGSTWSFCCNQQLGSLGAYNDTFSSVYRT